MFKKLRKNKIFAIFKAHLESVRSSGKLAAKVCNTTIVDSIIDRFKRSEFSV